VYILSYILCKAYPKDKRVVKAVVEVLQKLCGYKQTLQMVVNSGGIGNTYIHTYIHTHIHTCIYSYMYIRNTYIHTYIRTHICIHT